MVQLLTVCCARLSLEQTNHNLSSAFATGTWPYTYAACDVGTLPNQTNNGQPAGGVGLSYLPGQRLSACTCSGGDHPGPSPKIGRSAPEIDIFEALIDVNVFKGQVSQSLQVAPFNYQYEFDNTSSATPIQGSTTILNTYKGAYYQQAVSALSYISSSDYSGGFGTFAYEWWSNPNDRTDGYIQWYSEGKETWRTTYTTLSGDSATGISNRIIPEEPMVGGHCGPGCAINSSWCVVSHPKLGDGP
jgi:beta-glucan synthesis-associated protein KRE6